MQLNMRKCDRCGDTFKFDEKTHKEICLTFNIQPKDKDAFTIYLDLKGAEQDLCGICLESLRKWWND